MLYTFNPQYEQLFVPGHAYLVRACLDNENVSIQAEITALDVPADEVSAYNTIVTNKSLIRFLAPIQNGNDVSAQASDVESFVEQFPNSCYSQYLRFSYVASTNQPQFAKQAQSAKFKIELKSKCPWMDEYLQSH